MEKLLEIEEIIIGGLISDPNSLIKVSDKITPEHFTDKNLRLIYEEILKQYSKDQNYDLISLYDALKPHRIEASYLSKLSSNSISTVFIDKHCEILIEKNTRHRLKELGKFLSSANDLTDTNELLEQTEKLLFDISIKKKTNVFHISDPTNQLLEQIDAIKSNRADTSRLKTGFWDLDYYTGGFEAGNLYILAARPSMGKSSLMLNIAENISKYFPVFIISLEMSSENLAGRLIAQNSGISYLSLLSGRFENNENVLKASHYVRNLKIFIDDSASLNIQEIKSRIRKIKLEKDIKVVFIDYLQKITAKAESRVREMGLIASELKAIAKELKIPVIAVSQLSRSVEQRQVKRPNLSDLRDSGEIEQEADVVIFIYRPEYYKLDKFEDGTESKGKAEIIIAKNRNGSVGDFRLEFNQGLTRFENPKVQISDDGII